MIPRSKPQAGVHLIEAHAEKAWKANPETAKLPMPSTYVLAVRGYYRDTMGKVGENDVGIYDDAIFIVSPNHFSSWNANTDPSRYGWNAGAGKFMARLKPGVWFFHRIKHKISSPTGYMAYGQGAWNGVPGKKVTVERIKENKSIAQTESGLFGINLHRGGSNGTSSEGCQTIPVQQWNLFDKTLYPIVKDNWFPYILIEGPIN